MLFYIGVDRQFSFLLASSSLFRSVTSETCFLLFNSFFLFQQPWVPKMWTCQTEPKMKKRGKRENTNGRWLMTAVSTWKIGKTHCATQHQWTSKEKFTPRLFFIRNKNSKNVFSFFRAAAARKKLGGGGDGQQTRIFFFDSFSLSRLIHNSRSPSGERGKKKRRKKKRKDPWPDRGRAARSHQPKRK